MELNKEKIVEEFKKYFSNFDCDNENIKRKYYHSLRVMDFAEAIAKSENLPESDVEIAIIIGLLHDYSRFEQWKKYNTYNDLISIDHGDLAVDILFNQNHISKFYDKKENYEDIYNAIKYHNKLNIPENLNSRSKLFCKIIKDADKLDIMNIRINGILKFENCSEEISVDVKNSFYKDKLIDRKLVKNKNEETLVVLAMLYDYHFNFSYKYTIENNILNRLYEPIENKEMFKSYFEHLKEFLNCKALY